tara:strand:+ start:54 stop:590 length:537 start_codon:yes stop_codon:yes gene_type:complete
MNIFYLHKEPEVSARLHCDKHVVKMIIEYAQMLSTAHRMVDGEQYYGLSKNGRRIARWRHPNSNLENVLYKASHINHPSAVWVRENAIQYQYMYDLFVALCDEYTYRYGKVHMTDSKLRDVLNNIPDNMPLGDWREPPQAMPDDVKSESSLDAYHKYYREYKKSFAKWTNREVPQFML